MLLFAWFMSGVGPVQLRAERLPVRLFTSVDGLGSGFVDYLIRDSRGFMWFCTRDGLSRFDGSQLINYHVGDAESPPGVERISETRDGTYWITTTGGLFRFRSNSLSKPGSSKDRPQLNVERVASARGAVIEDQVGNLWYVAVNFSRLTEQDGKVVLQPVSLGLQSRFERPIIIIEGQVGSDGSIWMNSNIGLVRRLPDGRVILYQHENNVRSGSASLAVDKKGNVWVCWGQDLYVIRPRSIEKLGGLGQVTIQPLTPTYHSSTEAENVVQLPLNEGEITAIRQTAPVSQIRRLFVTSDGHVWISTGDQLLEYDGRSFETYGAAEGLATGLSQMAEDVAGNLWIGGQAGLLRLNRRGLKTYREADGLKSARLFSINEGVDGTLYFANGDFYISKFDGRGFDTVRPEIDPGARALWSSRYAFLSKDNEWWILTSDRLYRFSATNLHHPLAVYDNKHGLKANEAYQIFQDSRGDIWLSQQPGVREDFGLYRLKRGEKEFYRFSSAENLPEGKAAASFAEDHSGNLWIGFYEGGLARFANNRFEVVGADIGLHAGIICDLHVDKKGRLWIATALDGVRRVDDPGAATPTFVPVTTSSGLSSNNTRTITEDQNGDIYFGTVRGVDHWSEHTNQFSHISVNDGLAGDFVVDSFCDRSGAIWFATSNGLSRLIPRTENNQVPPNVFLGGLRIAGEVQPVAELGDLQINAGDLASGRNNLQIEFFALNFKLGETLRYQMKLEGADSQWSEPTEQRIVTYANLKPGAYRFLVRGINSSGLVSDKPASVTFRILPPIWLRWWFLSLITFFTLAVFYLIYRYRMARLREVNAALAEAKRAEEDLGRAREERLVELSKVRTRIATDLHDDIGASLTQIAILSEVVRQQNRQGNGASLDPLNSIVTVSNELVETMSDIVWAINPAKDSLQDLVQRMRRFSSDLLTAKRIAFRFDVPSYAPEVHLGANARREVYLIFKESLTNIIKHADASEVAIELHFLPDYLELQVSDNGKGFDLQGFAGGGNSTGMGGHGIMSMKKRAAEMNGHLEISSVPGQGTKITFQLPLDAVTRHSHGLAIQTGGDSEMKVP